MTNTMKEAREKMKRDANEATMASSEALKDDALTDGKVTLPNNEEE